MKFNTHRQLPIALLLGAFSLTASADSVTSINAAKINSANELVRAGEFAKAVEEYREIPVTDVTQDELNYNSGVALYRQGDVEAARALFSETSASGNNTLAAAARYNLGNCSYSDAVATAEQDKRAAIESLDQAITQYRASLRANPNHVDARANIELAVALHTKLKEELKQQQEQQQDQGQQDQEQNEDQESQQQQDADQQKSESEKPEGEKSNGEKSESEQSQESEQSPPQDSDSNGDEKPDDQQNAAEENDEAVKQPKEQESDKDEESDGKSQSAENKKADQQPESASQDAKSRPQSSQEPQSADEPSPDEQSEQNDDVVPSGELKPAHEQQEADGRPSTAGVPSANEELMTKVEAMKMLQSVRDRDMLRRLRQEQTERNRHVPTDRDW